MNYLIISGSQNTGKTETIDDLTQNLITKLGFTVVVSSFPTPKTTPVKDFFCIIEGVNGAGLTRRILINTATDDNNRIDDLVNFYKINSQVDIIITSSRDGGDNFRNQLFSKLRISGSDFVKEVPLAKILRRPPIGALTWYRAILQDLLLFIIKADPYHIFP